MSGQEGTCALCFEKKCRHYIESIGWLCGQCYASCCGLEPLIEYLAVLTGSWEDVYSLKTDLKNRLGISTEIELVGRSDDFLPEYRLTITGIGPEYCERGAIREEQIRVWHREQGRRIY